MDAFWHFAKQMLRWRTHLIFGLLFAVVSAGGMGAGILAMQPVLDTILEPGHRGLPQLAEEYASKEWTKGILTEDFIAALPEGPFDAVMWIMITLGVLTIFGAFANFMHQYLALTVVQRSIAMIRRRAFGQVIHLPLKTIVAEGPTEAISRIVNDTEALSAGYVALLSKAVAQITKGIIALVVALVTNWQLAIVALLLMPFLAVVIRKLGKRIRRASERALSSRAGLYRAATESLQGMRVVKVHTTERYEAGRFGRINKDVLHQQLRIRTARAIAGPLIETITVFTLGALTLVAVKLILDGHLDKSEFMTVLVALAIAGASIKPITGLVNDIQQSGAAADRLQRLLNEDAEPGHDIRMPKLPRHSESLVFNKVSFLYPGGSSRAVADVSLKIRAGETVAFVGPNGCGKTTLLSLVPRLFDPNDGQVLVDGIDITRIRVRSLRRQIGVVTQEVVLFKGTIRDNIAYGNINASDEQIRQAADRARATQFINQFDDGFETHVGEQGLTLSGGQRQRIAIARAILRDPAILILDEATSMVDAESERLIGEVLSTFCTNRTTLIVAHRLSTVLGADRIVVMDQGSIVATGTHEELLESCKLYQSLAQHQLISNDESTH